MATSWPSVTQANYGSDKAVRTARASGLVDRSEVLITQARQLEIAEKTAGGVVYSTMYTITWDVADHELGRTLSIAIEAYSSAGNGNMQLRDGTDLTTGPVVNLTTTSYGTIYTLTFDFAASYTTTSRSIEFRGRGGGIGQTSYFRSLNRATAWVSD